MECQHAHRKRAKAFVDKVVSRAEHTCAPDDEEHACRLPVQHLGLHQSMASPVLLVLHKKGRLGEMGGEGTPEQGVTRNRRSLGVLDSCWKLLPSIYEREVEGKVMLGSLLAQ